MAERQGDAAASQRVFLFLQGPSSPLFTEIAWGLEAAGHRCIRINLNLGDWIFWRRRGALNYRGAFAGWRHYVRRRIEAGKVTDVILLGEERPYHQVAIEEARQQGASINVVEMGYLRPDWVTIERDGMSSNSRFPVDPLYIVEAAASLPEPDWTRRFSHSFLAEAAYDLLYNIPNAFLWFLYPGYKRHALYHPLVEYAGWLRRLPSSGRRAREAEATTERLIADKTRFFVYPLQLQTDYQLRSHSPFNRQQDAIRQIMRSFVAHATSDSHLVVKLHPLDNDLVDWKGYIDAICAELGLSSRVHFIDGGNLEKLITASQGVVTVNSTVALSALQADRPVKALGAAIYDIEGLTDQRPLDLFWGNPATPSPDIRSAFLKLLAASVQVRGNFYSRAGARSASAEIVKRLLSQTVNLPAAYIDPPPRRRPMKINIP
ncbi:capsule biosynthesis protein [Rhizobium mayense]|uniref:Capsular biosynthesis protein n=1 Tax=Rhizobium mayense TaxID=1312184 RepID=A0ABT7JY63_9HYPH|nr:capsular biosynthesis protein [Rhizobium mayense]MDL2400862.1 capsular biosynthesis protein [Rhizobium mayense]